VQIRYNASKLLIAGPMHMLHLLCKLRGWSKSYEYILQVMHAHIYKYI